MFIKANLEPKLLTDIDRLNEYLAIQVFTHQYNTQLHPSAGLGCVPYHLTMLGPIDQHFSTSTEADYFTDKWESSSNLIEIFPTTTIRVTANGRVIWLVKAMNLKEVGLEMLDELNSKRLSSRVNNYVGSDTLHITLGAVTHEEDMNQNFEISDHLFMSLLHSYHICGFSTQA